MPIHAYAASTPGAPLEPFQYNPGPLAPGEVEIAVTHCGICHSDLHTLRGDWGGFTEPVVAGHEVVGTVAALGSAVEGLREGGRVGLGWQCGACHTCEWCLQGDQHLCPEHQATIQGHYGGFGDRVRADHRFVFALPEKLASENAAPLLCGGATVFSPLWRHGVTNRTEVGVIGIGGLGHLAVQFANAMGGRVTAFSTSPDKEAEAKKFGARDFVPTKDKKELKPLRGNFHLLLSTIHANVDWDLYLSLLRPGGVLCLVGVPGEPLSFSAGSLIGGQKTLTASMIAGRKVLTEMLAFAAKSGVTAQTETFPMAKVNEALARLEAGKARYRLVLVNEN